MENGIIAPIVSLNVEINNPNTATISVPAPKIVIAIMLFLLWLNKAKAEQYATYIVVITTVNGFISPLAPAEKSPMLQIIEIINVANRKNTEKTLSIPLTFIQSHSFVKLEFIYFQEYPDNLQ